MKFTKTSLAGITRIDLDLIGDARGHFARMFCQREFAEHGLATRFVQMNNSLAEHKGTLRGMHYQLPPKSETKVVRCIRGALLDVIIDLREDSPTYRQHVGFELSAENRRMLFIPAGFAHGFLTLSEDAEVFYQMSSMYVPGSASGVRYDDPAFGIFWPGEITTISEQDRTWPDFSATTRSS